MIIAGIDLLISFISLNFKMQGASKLLFEKTWSVHINYL